MTYFDWFLWRTLSFSLSLCVCVCVCAQYISAGEVTFREKTKFVFIDDDDDIVQGYSNLSREVHFPAEFSSNPNQTHLSMLINAFRIIRKSQVGEFDQGWS